jgi:hypothetical protein
VQDIRQKASDVLFTIPAMNFEAVSQVCADPDYKSRLLFVATAKVPTLRLKLHSGTDSLKQCKAFISRLQKSCQM